MKFLSELVRYFCYITTGILLVSGLSVLGQETIPAITSMQTLFAGFVTALITAVVLHGEPKNRRDMFCRLTLHYVLMCAVMVPIGMQFRWISRDFIGVLFMIGSVGGVYLFTTLSYWVTSRNEARELNRALQEKYRNED